MIVKLLQHVSQVYGVSSLGILLCVFTLYSLVSAAHMVDQQYELAQRKWSKWFSHVGGTFFMFVER